MYIVFVKETNTNYKRVDKRAKVLKLCQIFHGVLPRSEPIFMENDVDDNDNPGVDIEYDIP